MFKKLVPVIALALIAGPVFAADTPASTPASQSSDTAKSSHHAKKGHHKSSKSKKSATDSSNAPAK